MARITARDTFVAVQEDGDSGSTPISNRSNQATMAFTAEAPEVTSFGERDRTRLPNGIRDWTFTITGFTDLAANQLDDILYPLVGASLGTMFWYGPGGSTSGCTQYSSSAVCTEYSIEGGVDTPLSFTATFVNRSGSLTRGTF